MTTRLLLVLLVATLVACGGRREASAPASVSTLPVEYYQDAAARGDSVYRIDGAQSSVIVRVYRAGPLARLGHDHVVSSRDLSGYAALSAVARTTRADVLMPLATLDVDETDLRAAAGFESQPTEQDIADTRANMLSSLEAEWYPDVLVSARMASDDPAQHLEAVVRLHGVTQTFIVPVELQVTDDALDVSGDFELRQTQFGISPYSVFGGALSVADALRVAFRLHAARVLVPAEFGANRAADPAARP